MILDGDRSIEVSGDLVSDIVIVGAGTIGLYMASRLLNNSPNLNIVIVESGNLKPSRTSNIENSISVGKEHMGTHKSRFSGVGGTSCIWGGVLVEFENADFERLDSKWPLGYEEIKHFYKEVYSYLGLADVKSNNIYNKVFHKDIKKKEKLKSIYAHRLNRRNVDFAKYFKKVIKSKAVKIIINTTANKINFDKNEAIELECISGNGRIIRVQAKKFIFASGTISINQFFLTTQLSNNVPWKENQYIGKFFQDHMRASVGSLKFQNRKLFRKLFKTRIIDGNEVEHRLIFDKNSRANFDNGVMVYFENIRNIENDEIVFEINSFIKHFGFKIKANELSTFIRNLYIVRVNVFHSIMRRIFTKRVEIFFNQGYLVNVQSEQIPISESQITISKKDKLKNGLNKVIVHWDWSGKEIIAIRAIITELEKYLIQKDIGVITLDERIMNKDPDILKICKDTSHHCGGMRMSSVDKNGVVDSQCKVWGTNNVWIAGSAVFPSSSYANSTLTALALAERIVQKSICKTKISS